MNHLKQYSKRAAVEAYSDSLAFAQSTVNKAAAMSLKAQAFFVTTALVGYYAIFASASWALGAKSGCKSEASTNITGFIDSAAKFLMAIAGALAVLMFVVGGALIIAGGQQSRVNMGFKFLKNALIGLGVVAIAAFIQMVVLEFLTGATSTNTPGCLKDGQSGVS